MPAVVKRFKWHDAEFTEFAHSDQMRDPTVAAAQDIARAATGSQMASKEPYVVNPAGPSVTIDGKSRLSVYVEGHDPLHAVEEFGSGPRSEGNSAGQDRPQGGYSEARRTLIRSANVIIPPLTKRPG